MVLLAGDATGLPPGGMFPTEAACWAAGERVVAAQVAAGRVVEGVECSPAQAPPSLLAPVVQRWPARPLRMAGSR